MTKHQPPRKHFLSGPNYQIRILLLDVIDKCCVSLEWQRLMGTASARGP